MKVLYLDVLFLVNFFVDFLLLTVSALISGEKISRIKFTASAAVGGIYAILTVFPQFDFLTLLTVKIMFSSLLCIIGFGFLSFRKLLRMTLIYFLASITCAGCVCAISNLFGGISGLSVEIGVFYINIAPSSIVISGAIVYLLLGVILKGYGESRSECSIVKAQINAHEKIIELRTLIDTGNCLRDPLTNSPVLIVWKTYMNTILNEKSRQIISHENLDDAVGTFQKLIESGEGRSFRLIPYTSVGTKSGMLIAFSVNCISLNGEITKTKSIAMCEHPLSDTGSFEAIISA